MKALPIWEQTLVLDPRNATWLKYGAGTYVMLRQFPAALKTYDRALDITPNDLDLVACKALIYQAEGDLEQAGKLLAGISAYNQALKDDNREDPDCEMKKISCGCYKGRSKPPSRFNIDERIYRSRRPS